MVGSRRVAAWCGVAKTAPHFPKSTRCGPREIRHGGGGPERDMAAAYGDADWAARVLVTGISIGLRLGRTLGFSGIKPWLTFNSHSRSWCGKNSTIEARPLLPSSACMYCTFVSGSCLPLYNNSSCRYFSSLLQSHRSTSGPPSTQVTSR